MNPSLHPKKWEKTNDLFSRKIGKRQTDAKTERRTTMKPNDFPVSEGSKTHSP